MRILMIVVLLVGLAVPLAADNLADEIWQVLKPDETGGAVMLTKDADLKLRAVSSWKWAEAFTVVAFVDVWSLSPKAGGLSFGQEGQSTRLFVGYEDGLVGGFRQVVPLPF